MSYKTLAVVMLIALSVTGWAYGEGQKKPSDRQRIEMLEQKVMNLETDLGAEHQWAEDVNKTMTVLDGRTWDLNDRLHAVETRGPVAKR